MCEKINVKTTMLNLTTEESVEHSANYFAKISQEYPPLDRDLLPERVKVKIKT